MGNFPQIDKRTGSNKLAQDRFFFFKKINAHVLLLGSSEYFTLHWWHFDEMIMFPIIVIDIGQYTVMYAYYALEPSNYRVR